MAQRCAHLVPVALLVFGLAGILLLTIPTEDVREEPELRVRSDQCVSVCCVKGVKQVVHKKMCGTREFEDIRV